MSTDTKDKVTTGLFTQTDINYMATVSQETNKNQVAESAMDKAIRQSSVIGPEIVILLDDSQSMIGVKDEVKRAYGTFVGDMCKSEPNAKLTLYKYGGSSCIKMHLKSKPIEEVNRLVYFPSQATYLPSNLMYAIKETEARLPKTARVIFVVICDDDTDQDCEDGKVMCQEIERKKRDGWRFLHIGLGDGASHPLCGADKNLLLTGNDAVKMAFEGAGKFVSEKRDVKRLGLFEKE